MVWSYFFGGGDENVLKLIVIVYSLTVWRKGEMTIKWCGVTFLGGGDENVLKLIVAIYVNFVNTLKT